MGTVKQQYIKNQEEIEQQQAKLKAQERQLAQLTASYNDIDQVNLQFSNKQEVWDAIELLPETTLESVDNKTASQIIKKLESLSSRNK